MWHAFAYAILLRAYEGKYSCDQRKPKTTLTVIRGRPPAHKQSLCDGAAKIEHLVGKTYDGTACEMGGIRCR